MPEPRFAGLLLFATSLPACNPQAVLIVDSATGLFRTDYSGRPVES